jgi:cytochrome oxidase assembly protein ShyY1
MKIFKSAKSIKISTKLIIIVLLIIYIMGFFSVLHIWQVFNQVNKIDFQKIEASVTHFNVNLIKEVCQKINNK